MLWTPWRPAGYAISVRVLGVDFGERRIGLALSDVTATLATPWRAVEASGSAAQVADLIVGEAERLASEDDGLAAIVVGLPRHLDGRPHEQTTRVLAIVEALWARTGIHVALQDERLTSREAERRLALREPDWRRRKARVDAAAAAIILQDYLDQRTGAGG